MSKGLRYDIENKRKKIISQGIESVAELQKDQQHQYSSGVREQSAAAAARKKAQNKRALVENLAPTSIKQAEAQLKTLQEVYDDLATREKRTKGIAIKKKLLELTMLVNRPRSRLK